MKVLPLLVVLAVGIAAGVLIVRMSADAPPEPVLPATAQPVLTIESRPQGQDVPARAFGSPASRPVAQVPPPAPAVPPHAPAGNHVDASSDPGVTQRIDVGPVFRQQFETAAKAGHQDAMADAHRALERELRDDSWAYPLEAEIENSLVADTSMGNFRKEHLECRSTLCEIRLTASGAAQVEALKEWTSDIQKLPWGTELILSSASTISSDNQMDALLILKKPPAPPAQD
jgi:hypothetical protein